MSLKKLGRFEIIREIGKGAMGVVYLAHDPRIDRKIAIKMISIPAGLSSDEARESRHRFVREAQAAGKLQHPNIITIYDVVEEPDLSYIAMEYIDGETLEAYTRPGSLLPLHKVLSIAAQACSALDYAHKNQVIHRDIKPANLMMVKGELLKITDFGLAKHPEANLTQAGVLIGTPNYMSPEQISGKPMDGRSDIFSLGVVLYEMLTGERPFGGDTISTIIYRILYEEARPPRILNEKLPAAFDGIMKKALAKDPAERFQGGAEFVEAMNDYSTYHLKMPVSGAPPTVRVGRDESVLRRPASERAAGRFRPVPVVRAPLFAGQPAKITAFALALLLALLVFPRRIHEVEQGPKAGAPGTGSAVAQNQAGFGVPTLRPAPELSRLTGRQATVVTDPPGARLFLDNKEHMGNVVKLSQSDQGEHTLLAVGGCQEGSVLIQGAQLEDEIRLSLKPKIAELRIDSKPSDALVFLNDKPLGRTPTILPSFNACEPATFVLRKANHRDFRKTFDGTQTWSEIAGTLASVTLSEIPPGYAKLAARPPYPVKILAGDKPVELKDDTITLAEGKHRLTLRSPEVFFKRVLEVSIKGSETLDLRVDWPGLGSLTVQAEPSNCKIFVDGEELDYAPITGAKIVAGEHVIRAEPVADPSRAQEHRVTIEAGSTTVEKFTFIL